MANSGKDVMAVQTLRNFVMGASLMATTAAFLILGTLTLSGQAENIAHSWHAVNLAGSSSAGLWVAKVVLLADFIVAFFALAMAIRLANHVVFMINVPGPAPHPLLAPEQVARRLNLAGAHFATGMRAFFFAVPLLVFWLFGPALARHGHPRAGLRPLPARPESRSLRAVGARTSPSGERHPPSG